MVRGYIALGLIGILFLAADVIERLIIVALVRLLPQRKERVLTPWARSVSALTLGILSRIGGATIGTLPRIPCRPGVLVMMNHQSLIDIPLVIKCLESGYPWIVTRRRYAQGIPLVSHMLRFFGHPIVEPGGGGAQQIDSLRRAAHSATRPIVIFPEGTRTRDGEIGSFKSGGLKAILASGPWLVYLVVTDGFWRYAMLPDLARNAPTVRGRIECLGPFPSPPAGEDDKLFIDELRSRMCLKLQEMRGQSAAEEGP